MKIQFIRNVNGGTIVVNNPSLFSEVVQMLQRNAGAEEDPSSRELEIPDAPGNPVRLVQVTGSGVLPNRKRV